MYIHMSSWSVQGLITHFYIHVHVVHCSALDVYICCALFLSLSHVMCLYILISRSVLPSIPPTRGSIEMRKRYTTPQWRRATAKKTYM